MSDKGHKYFFIKPFIYLLALVVGIYLVLYIEAARPSDFGFYEDIFKKEIVIERSDEYPLREPVNELTSEELKYARVAWRFFQNNVDSVTGLNNSVEGYPSTTLWDITSYLNGLVSAYEIGIIDSFEFNARLQRCLGSMKKIKLYDDMLPNKAYNTKTLAMTDYDNHESYLGIGWSAMDIGRFYSFAYKIFKDYPQYNGLVKQVVERWDVEHIIDDATLHSISYRNKDRLQMVVQEGKLGYEEYAAKGLMLMGYDVSEAMKYTDFIDFIKIYGIEIAVDTREVPYYPSYNYILSEPYILDGLEYGWDVSSRELAYRLFRVQKKRYQKEDIITAVSEDHVDRPPYFVYNCVYIDGAAWKCVSEAGEEYPQFDQVSTKAAFGWYVLFDDEYSDLLLESVKDLYDENRGWFSGRYHQSGKVNQAITANTNGIILECLNYKLHGPLCR